MTLYSTAPFVIALALAASCSFTGVIEAPEGAGDEAAASEPQEAAEDPTEDAGEDDEEVVGDPTNSGCVSERVEVPSDDNCTCSFDSCDASSLDCTCDLACYAGGDCLLNTDADGNTTTSNGLLGTCDLSCTPENDLSTEMNCSASNCEPTPNSVDINPTSAPTAPATSSAEMERSPQNVGVLFVIDNSGSMQDDQMAAACAVQSFFDAAGQNGATYQTGVITTDMQGTVPGSPAVYDDQGNYLGPPEMVSVDGTCSVAPVCACGDADAPAGSTCAFAGEGEWTQNSAANAEATLEQLMVQGDDGSPNEGGLEQTFQFLAEMERDGTFAASAPKEVVVISDENGDADGFLCPFNAVDRHTQGIPNFTPPAPDNTDDSCQQDLIDFYTYYFTSRGIIVHAINYTSDCGGANQEELGTIYSAVVQATGGHMESICHCERFDDFFTNVGQTTSDLSTSLCFDDVTPDPATIQVTYTEGGASTLVPKSGSDGWTYDSGLNCVVFAGSWADRFGSFAIEYLDVDAPMPPPTTAQACLAPGVDPLLDSLEVTCGGDVVLQDPVDGWTFDPVTDCFTFHGDSVAIAGSCDVEYF